MMILVGLFTFVAMEGVARFTHRYVMHGPLWVLHASHHEQEGGLEYNDLFAVFFSVGAALLLFVGIDRNVPVAAAVGLGMSAYGLAYLVLHDAVTHRRFGRFPRPRSGYASRLIKAHLLHHASEGERGSYGFLWVSESEAEVEP